jgi:hypothetical protein
MISLFKKKKQENFESAIKEHKRIKKAKTCGNVFAAGGMTLKEAEEAAIRFSEKLSEVTLSL